MDFAGHLVELAGQAAALRAAAVAAGPGTVVPTCPEWTVQDLVRHVARVHNWATHALRADPAGQEIEPDEAPAEWAALLSWWDDQVGLLLERLGAGGPDAPAWVFDAEDAPTMAFWARRQAHETAIHRLDAEHADLGSMVPVSLYDRELAVDGIDEVLTKWVPRLVGTAPPDLAGAVRFEATDAGRTWLVRLVPGAAPALDGTGDGDAAIVGSADAVYRAAWHRPSIAAITGDRTLVAALRTP